MKVLDGETELPSCSCNVRQIVCCVDGKLLSVQKWCLRYGCNTNNSVSPCDDCETWNVHLLPTDLQSCPIYLQYSNMIRLHCGLCLPCFLMYLVLHSAVCVCLFVCFNTLCGFVCPCCSSEWFVWIKCWSCWENHSVRMKRRNSKSGRVRETYEGVGLMKIWFLVDFVLGIIIREKINEGIRSVAFYFRWIFSSSFFMPSVKTLW